MGGTSKRGDDLCRQTRARGSFQSIVSCERLVVVRLAAAAMALVVGTAAPAPAWAGNGQPEAAPKADSLSETDVPASEADKARELAQNGRSLYWNGDYRQAIEAFTEAYELVADPNLLYNISAAYEKLGEYDQALSYLDRYAPEAPEEEKDAIAARRRELEAAKAEATKEPDPGPGPLPDDPADPDGPEGPTDPGTIEPTDTGFERPKVMGGLGWALVGVAGAGLAVGAGFGIASLSQSKRGRDECFDDGGDLRCPSSARSPLEAARRDAIIADVGFGVAVLATAAALTVMGIRLRARKRAQDQPPKVSLGGLGATLRF